MASVEIRGVAKAFGLTQVIHRAGLSSATANSSCRSATGCGASTLLRIHR